MLERASTSPCCKDEHHLSILTNDPKPGNARCVHSASCCMCSRQPRSYPLVQTCGGAAQAGPSRKEERPPAQVADGAAPAPAARDPLSSPLRRPGAALQSCLTCPDRRPRASSGHRINCCMSLNVPLPKCCSEGDCLWGKSTPMNLTQSGARGCVQLQLAAAGGGAAQLWSPRLAPRRRQLPSAPCAAVQHRLTVRQGGGSRRPSRSTPPPSCRGSCRRTARTCWTCLVSREFTVLRAKPKGMLIEFRWRSQILKALVVLSIQLSVALHCRRAAGCAPAVEAAAREHL
jgi:hypothetical protein